MTNVRFLLFIKMPNTQVIEYLASYITMATD